MHDYLYIYNHCALKICNEAVVKGMCSVVGKHDASGRSLTFRPLAMESIIDYNKPSTSRSNALLKQALDIYFTNKNYATNSCAWRFFMTDTNRHRLPTSVVSPMINRLKNENIGLPIMEWPIHVSVGAIQWGRFPSEDGNRVHKHAKWQEIS